MQLCDNCETILRMLSLNYHYLFLVQENLSIESRHITAIHIYSVEVHDKTEDMCTLYPLPYKTLWHKFDVHVA